MGRVDNTAEATATGALYSDTAAKYAVLAKTTRNATIGFVVLGYAIYWASRGRAQQIDNKAQFLWQKFPKFILGFLFLSLVGWVRNRHDGSVEALLIGDGPAVEAMIEACRQGPGMARVDDIARSPAADDGSPGFAERHTV